MALDDGELRIRDGLRIALVEQEPVLLQRNSLKESLLAQARVPQEHKLNEFLHRFGLEPVAIFNGDTADFLGMHVLPITDHATVEYDLLYAELVVREPLVDARRILAAWSTA